MKKTSTAILLTILALFISACVSLADDIPPPPGSNVSSQETKPPTQINTAIFPVVPPDPAQGKAIYLEKCAPCHGLTGNGDGPSAAELSVPVAPLGDPQLARQRSPVDWFNTVTQGNIERFMPPFASLTDRQRWDVTAYAFTLSESSELVEQGEVLYQANCADCHGVTGLGDGSQADAANPPGDFSNLKTMAEKSGAQLVSVIETGLDDAMPGYADQFNDQEMWALASYLRHLGYATTETIAGEVETAPDEDPSAIDETAQGAESENALEAQTGTVQVALKDADGLQLQTDHEVTLYAFDNMEFVYSTTVTTPINGLYLFKDLELSPERAFLSSVDYQGVIYGSDVGVPIEPDSPINLEITVFDTTTDTSALIIDRLHIFFDFSAPENVQVVELYILRNTTNQTIVASEKDGPVVEYNLPQDAANLQFEDGVLGDRYILTESGFADTSPIRAGSDDHQVVFAYSLPYNRKLSFSQSQQMTVNSAVILAPEGIKLRGDNLKDEGLRDMQGKNFQMYSMESLPAHSQIDIEISGRPKNAAAAPNDSRTNLLIGLGALGVALIVAGVWLYRRDRFDEDDEDFEDEIDDEVEDEIPADPSALMDAIIALDDLYKQGDLPEEAYQQRRNGLKTRLRQVIDQE